MPQVGPTKKIIKIIIKFREGVVSLNHESQTNRTREKLEKRENFQNLS